MDASLYVHIPFCSSKCAYCDFFSLPRKNWTDFASYISAVYSEIAFYRSQFGIKKWSSVYIGGGTPSVLPPDFVKMLFENIFSNAPPKKNAEITFEANPESLTADLLLVLERVGVNRISLGLQSLSDKALSSVGRTSSAETGLNALSLLEEKWSGSVSVDFIASLPFQKKDDFLFQFDEISRFSKINHVSLYSLTIYEETPLFEKIERNEIPFDEDYSDSLWILGREKLEKLGFFQYEVSNFAKKGFESVHNSSYWLQKNYVGVGTSSSGTLYDFEKCSAFRWTNVKNVASYVDFWNQKPRDFEKIPREIEILDKKTLEFEFLMTGFRLLSGVSGTEFFARFGFSILDRKNSEGIVFSKTFEKWENRALAARISKKGDERFFLTKNGILFLNAFLEELL